MKHALHPPLLWFAACLLAAASGCSLLLPEVAHRPVIRNPFPQLSRVAVAPFFNHSDEPTVDGREFALAYFAELQATPGFEVAPLGVVEETILRHQIDLSHPDEARRLARLLGVDAVIVGAVTDFSPYYPPRVGLRVEWYTANAGYHEIPVGYGLPWNTPEEEFIPDSLVYESQLAMARVEMAEQAPICHETIQPLPAPPAEASRGVGRGASGVVGASAEDPFDDASLALAEESAPSELLPPGQQATPVPELAPAAPLSPGTAGTTDSIATDSSPVPSFSLPGLRPAENSATSCLGPETAASGRPECIPYAGPVLSHTQIYRGNDPDVTQALRGYVHFQDDARFGGWEGYLQRSDDYIRFCCHLHISEMLSARGGSRKTSVVWRWPEYR